MKGNFKSGDLVEASTDFRARIASSSVVLGSTTVFSFDIKKSMVGIIKCPVNHEPELYEVVFEIGGNETVLVEAENYQLQYSR